jgi:hypothetical protein
LLAHTPSHSPATIFEQIGQRQLLGLVVHLQRADAGRQVDHTVQVFAFQGLHQGVAAEAQDEIQFRRADFQQQVGIAGESGDQAGIVLADVQHHGEARALWERVAAMKPPILCDTGSLLRLGPQKTRLMPGASSLPQDL